MDTKKLLEQLLESGRNVAAQGKELAQKGVDLAADKMGVPEGDSEQREAMVSGLKKGAIAGGLLALFVGTKTGRKVAAPVLKIGSLAALGTLGYKVYSDWKKNQGIEQEHRPHIGSLDGSDANDRSLSIIKAMIGAAKSDGHIDDKEQEVIVEKISAVGLDASAQKVLMTELQKPLDVAEIASGADSPQTAVEMYLASLMVVDVDNQQERDYLNELAGKLNLSPDLVRQIELEAFTAA